MSAADRSVNLHSKKILVTGGSGFLGSVVVRKLKDRGYKHITVPRSKDYDLVRMDAVQKLYSDVKPDIVIHLAARVGGIGANEANQAAFFYSNLMMGVQLMEMGRLSGIEKFVAIGTICAYPKYTPVPFKEENLWDGYPEETNAAYGMAKKMMLVMSQTYRRHYNFNSIYLLPVNLFGPGDNFDLATSHVIPAIIRKCFEAIDQGKSEIVLWGTGKPSREFLYVDDAAEAIVLAMEKYNSSEPVNLGAGFEMTVSELAETIKKMTGFKGRITWDPSRPDGQPRRSLNTERAEKEFGFKASTPFLDGLKKTVDWYAAQRKSLEGASHR
jgi:GDP-L-fucose synthase